MQILNQEFKQKGNEFYTHIHSTYNFAGRDFGWKGSMPGVSLNKHALSIIAIKGGIIVLTIGHEIKEYRVSALDWVNWCNQHKSVYTIRKIELMVMQLEAIEDYDKCFRLKKEARLS
jgi:hypothetical protein